MGLGVIPPIHPIAECHTIKHDWQLSSTAVKQRCMACTQSIIRIAIHVDCSVHPAGMRARPWSCACHHASMQYYHTAHESCIHRVQHVMAAPHHGNTRCTSYTPCYAETLATPCHTMCILSQLVQNGWGCMACMLLMEHGTMYQCSHAHQWFANAHWLAACGQLGCIHYFMVTPTCMSNTHDAFHCSLAFTMRHAPA